MREWLKRMGNVQSDRGIPDNAPSPKGFTGVGK